MSNYIKQLLQESAPGLLDNYSDAEILTMMFEALTKTEQNKIVNITVQDWNGEPHYDLL